MEEKSEAKRWLVGEDENEKGQKRRKGYVCDEDFMFQAWSSFVEGVEGYSISPGGKLPHLRKAKNILDIFHGE